MIQAVRNRGFHLNIFYSTIIFVFSLNQKASLHEAAEGGLMEEVKSLVGKGADINIKDDKGVMRVVVCV